MSSVVDVVAEDLFASRAPADAAMNRLGAWFEAEYQQLLRFAYLVSGDRAVAEDLVQEAFVRLHRAGARAERTGVRAYAQRAIVNLHRSRLRRIVAERRALGLFPELAPAADPADTYTDDLVWRALNALSARQRACLVLRYYQDLKERDVAEALGMSVGAVKKHTDRALRKLRAAIDRSEQP